MTGSIHDFLPPLLYIKPIPINIFQATKHANLYCYGVELSALEYPSGRHEHREVGVVEDAGGHAEPAEA